MKKIIAAILMLIAILVLAPKLIKPKDIHFHAGFQVYVDDKLQDFSGNKYMDETPCTKNGKPLPDVKVDDQLEKAHLHDHTGNVVHTHRSRAEWADLFKNIKYSVSDDKAVGYIDGKKTEDFLDENIKPYQNLIIFVGKHTNDKKYLKDAVTKDYLKEVEKRSESCSS